MHPQLQPKKTKIRLYYPIILQQKASNVLYITNKKEYGLCHQYNVWVWSE